MKSTNTFVKLFGSVSTLAVVAGAMALNSVALGQTPWYTVLEQAPNPAVVTDAALRLKIVESGLPWRIQDTGTGIEMLLIPSDTFQMGTSPGDDQANSDESPVHQVTLTNAFYLGKTEVTQAQWLAIMGSNPSTFKNYSDSPSRPVEGVSWNDIAGFNTATGLRLPNEAEWEYAYRGNTTTAFHSMPGYPNGTNTHSLLGGIAWYGSNSGYATHAVAGKAANAFGMYDMSGNVFEWCNDWYGSYAEGNATDPAGPSSGVARVLRGGHWNNTSQGCRSSLRINHDPDQRNMYFGFRVARTAFPSNDFDGDDIPNATDNCPYVANPTQADCDGNGVGDACEQQPDCNANGIPDLCDITNGVAQDCNNNGVPDSCEILSGAVTDINGNNIPDSCDVVSGLLNDYNHNGIADSAELITVTTQLAVVTAQLACGDLDGSGDVGSDDLGLLLLNYGRCEGASLTTQQPQEPMIFPIEAAKPVAVKK